MKRVLQIVLCSVVLCGGSRILRAMDTRFANSAVGANDSVECSFLKEVDVKSAVRRVRGHMKRSVRRARAALLMQEACRQNNQPIMQKLQPAGSLGDAISLARIAPDTTSVSVTLNKEILFDAARSGDVGRVLACLQGIDANARDAGQQARLRPQAASLYDALARGVSNIHMQDTVPVAVALSKEILFAAVLHNDVDTVSACLSQGIDANTRDVVGGTALTRAAALGRAEIVEVLLTYKNAQGCFDVEVEPGNLFNHTPLMMAAGRGHVAVVQVILKRGGIDVNKRDTFGCSALRYAGNNSEIRQTLIEHGALE